MDMPNHWRSETKQAIHKVITSFTFWTTRYLNEIGKHIDPRENELMDSMLDSSSKEKFISGLTALGNKFNDMYRQLEHH
jgi:hypothetical protein